MNSEKLDQQRYKGKRYVRRALFLSFIATFLLALVVIGIAADTDEALTHPARVPLTTNPANYGLRYQNVSFFSRIDHIPLKGWFMPAASPSDRTIIFAHGHATNRQQSDSSVMFLFPELVHHGYNVFTFDFRDSGESGGTIDTVGQFEQRDLAAALDVMKSRPTGRHIGFLGYSMGAAVSLLVAANDPRVEAVVADASFADLQQYLDSNVSKFSHLPRYPFTPIMEWLSVPLTGFDPATVQPIKSIARIAPRPILLIHGEADKLIDVENSRELLAAAHNPHAQLWTVPNAGHVQSFQTEPQSYLKHILTFFDNGLGK